MVRPDDLQRDAAAAQSVPGGEDHAEAARAGDVLEIEALRDDVAG
jgi:hypothetical protein